MNNYMIIMQYNGRNYNGWQKQYNTANTIQNILETCISESILQLYEFKTTIQLYGSGRTDAGVHAKGQVANFKLPIELNDVTFLVKVNGLLPQDIQITSLIKVSNEFHSRLSCVGKLYSYHIDNGTYPGVFLRNYTYHIPDKLDIVSMKKAASVLIGEHDFSSFCTAASEKSTTIRTIYNISFLQIHNEIIINYHGNGFLYNMVRILTGTLIDVGLHRIDETDIADILGSKNRALAKATAPANALFLEKVFY